MAFYVFLFMYYTKKCFQPEDYLLRRSKHVVPLYLAVSAVHYVCYCLFIAGLIALSVIIAFTDTAY